MALMRAGEVGDVLEILLPLRKQPGNTKALEFSGEALGRRNLVIWAAIVVERNGDLVDVVHGVRGEKEACLSVRQIQDMPQFLQDQHAVEDMRIECLTFFGAGLADLAVA